MVRHIVWDDSFKVDHHLIDSQHKRLFAMVDELYNFTLKTQEQQKEDIMMVLQECVKFGLQKLFMIILEEIKLRLMICIFFLQNG